MATLETFKGTTAQVNAALASNPVLIGTNTVVTITDDAYTLTGLQAIILAVGQNKVILEKAASTPIEGTATELKDMLAGVSSYTGDLTVDSASEVSAADLNTIAKGTTGKVTATLAVATPLTKATVDALADVKATDVITFAPTAKTADAAILVAINKIISNANFTEVATITAAAADVALVKEALAYSTVDEPAVTITGAISAADVNAIAKATDGKVTATIADGTVAATLKAIKDVVVSGDVITFKTTDTTVKATELKALALLVDTLDATSIKTITAAAADVADVAAAAAKAPTAAVTITGSILAANANTIAAATKGVLTATITGDTAANLLDALDDTNTSDILALTVNDASLAAASTTALVSLLEKTGGKIKVTSGTVTGSIEDLTSIYVTNKAKFEGLGNEAVTITDADGVSAAQLNAIAAATTGKVTATLSSDTPLNAATVTALKDVKTTDDIAFESSAEVLNSVEAFNALLAINKIISGADFTAVATITAAAADVALVKEVLKYVDATVAVKINGEISATDASAIAQNSVLTATIKAGTVKDTLKAIEDVDAADVITFKTTDKSADASELVTLATKVDDFDASSVKTITAKSKTNVTEALAIAEDAAVTITGNVAVADIKAILEATTGKVTATLAAGVAADIATALADDEVNAINVTVNDAVAAAAADDLLAIKDLTSGKITVTAKDVSGSFDDLKELYVTSKGKFTALGDEAVKITDEVSAADANIIAKAVNGVVTATVEAAEASELISQLKDAKSTDKLSLTVSGESVKASELNVLNGKTSGTVTVDGDVVISGNIADLTKVFATGSGITTANNAVTILGTVSAKDANAIATKTSSAVTATIAADTAAKLKVALTDNSANKLNLTVNGAKADADDLANLLTKTTEKITVTAKEINGSLEDIKEVLVTKADKFTGLDKVAVKIIGDVDAADLDGLDDILAATSGIVTATVSGTAAGLVGALENAKANDALKLIVTGPSSAADLLALDGKSSVVVDAKDISITAITGTAADVKKLLASKGVSLAKNVAIEIVQDTEVSAADVNAIAKATTGKVTATVAAGTAAALNKALGNATKDDALKLEVSGKTATAADLLALDGKTSVEVGAKEVESITGTVADLKKVFTAAQLATPTIELADEVAVSVSGTVKASDLNAVLTAADGIVTATVAAEKASVLVGALTGKNADDALKVTITDTKVDAEDLLTLDGATSIAVNAASVKTITGTADTDYAKDVLAAYQVGADKGISGLGNEAVDLTGATDANAELVSAINDFTTGLIKLPTVTFDDDVATTFSLSDLGDLKGITGLKEINAKNGKGDSIDISIKDLLVLNKGTKEDFEFTITGDAGDKVEFSDVSGWTKDVTGYIVTDKDGDIVFTNSTTNQVVTITLTDVIYA